MTNTNFIASNDYGLSGFGPRPLEIAFADVVWSDVGQSLSELTSWDRLGESNRTTFAQGTSISDASGIVEFAPAAMMSFSVVVHPHLAGVRTNVRLTVSRLATGTRIEAQLYLGHLVENAPSPTEAIVALANYVASLVQRLGLSYLALCDENDEAAILPNGIWLPSLLVCLAQAHAMSLKEELERVGALMTGSPEGDVRIIWLMPIERAARGETPGEAAIGVFRSYLERAAP